MVDRCIVVVVQLEPVVSFQTFKSGQLCDLLTDHQHIPLLLRDYAAEEIINHTIER
jgi:hypothetical protein